MMMHRKFHRAAALVLAMVLMLGLVACGSQTQPEDFLGKWITADGEMALYFKDEIDGLSVHVAFLHQYDYPDEDRSYYYTIDGNVVKLERDNGETTDEILEYESDAPDELELTLESGFLGFGKKLVGGDLVFTKAKD